MMSLHQIQTYRQTQIPLALETELVNNVDIKAKGHVSRSLSGKLRNACAYY